MSSQDGGEAFSSSIYRVKLETYSRNKVLALVGVFMGLFLFSLIGGAAGPFVWRASHGDGYAWDNCTEVLLLEVAMENPLQYVTDWSTPTFDPTDPSQSLAFEASEMVSAPPEALEFNIRMDISVSGVRGGFTYPILPYSSVSRLVKCKNRVTPFCRNITVFAENSVEFDEYSIRAKFYHPRELYCKTWAEGGGPATRLEFTMRYMNSDFTSFEIGFKYFFVVVSVTVFIAFGISLLRIGSHTSYEQKWILALLGLLVLYNDPFVAAEIYSASLIYSAFSVLFDVTFVTGVLSFWLCMIDMVRKSAQLEFVDRPRGTSFYLPKAVLMTAFWFSTVAVYMWVRMQQLGDPLHNEPTDLKHFVFIKMLSFLVLGIYGIWLLYLIIRSMAILRRLRIAFVFFFGLTGFVAVVVFVGVAVGAYSPLPATKTNFLPFVTLSNIYLFVLAWAYHPADTLASGGLDPDGIPDRAQMVQLQTHDDVEDDVEGDVATAEPSRA